MRNLKGEQMFMYAIEGSGRVVERGLGAGVWHGKGRDSGQAQRGWQGIKTLNRNMGLGRI